MQVVTEAQMRHELTKIPSGRIVVSGNFATPQRLLDLYEESNHGEWSEPRTIHALNPQKFQWPRSAAKLETTFVGPGFRKDPRLVYVPSRLSMVPDLYKNDQLPVDAVFLHVSPGGNTCSLGIEVNVMPAAIEACRRNGGKVFAMVNPQMPYTFGDAQIPSSLIDYAIEHSEPIPSANPAPPSKLNQTIAQHVADEIPDFASLQMGIGGVPDAVLDALHDRVGMRVWSEMISDGVMKLDEAGAIGDPDGIVTSFAFGSDEFYAWLDANRDVRFYRTETVNDPTNIAGIRRMMSINTAMQVDLFGEANASRIGGRIFSGFGVQTDFIVGALHSPEGKAFLALASWHPKADVSTIVPRLTAGVTSVQPSHIVTEFGIAELRGFSESEQAAKLIRVAHPDARPELFDEAADMFGLVA